MLIRCSLLLQNHIFVLHRRHQLKSQLRRPAADDVADPSSPGQSSRGPGRKAVSSLTPRSHPSRTATRSCRCTASVPVGDFDAEEDGGVGGAVVWLQDGDLNDGVGGVGDAEAQPYRRPERTKTWSSQQRKLSV
ncbi:hypothetical protein BHM03_00038367 [Ensete ventricosum]|nr:hypothetical protein BHM03_00038367 [Ensete ventricosum]